MVSADTATPVHEAPVRDPRPDKVATVDEISQRLQSAQAVFVTEYRGLSVLDFQQLRRGLRGVGAECSVVKCTLARRAAAKADLAEMEAMLEGPVALIYCGEDVAPAAKVLSDFARDHDQLLIKAGILEGSRIGDSDIRAIAKLPSREILLAEIAGLFQAPLAQFAALLAAPLQDFLALQDALLEKRQAEGAGT